MQQIQAVGGLGVNELKDGSANASFVPGSAYSVYTANLEPIGPTSVVAAVHIVTHHQDDVEKVLKLVGVPKVLACGLQQVDSL